MCKLCCYYYYEYEWLTDTKHLFQCRSEKMQLDLTWCPHCCEGRWSFSGGRWAVGRRRGAPSGLGAARLLVCSIPSWVLGSPSLLSPWVNWQVSSVCYFCLLFAEVLLNAPVCKKIKMSFSLFFLRMYFVHNLTFRPLEKKKSAYEFCLFTRQTLQKREKLTFMWINKSNNWPKHKLLSFTGIWRNTLILDVLMIRNFLWVLWVSWIYPSKCQV